MVCIQCGADTRVANSRLQKRSNHVWRRRSCNYCGTIFTTLEIAQYEALWLVKISKTDIQPFLRDKLLVSLYKSLGHRPGALQDAAGLADTVITKIPLYLTDSAIPREQLITLVSVTLSRFDTVASAHYQAYHKQ